MERKVLAIGLVLALAWLVHAVVRRQPTAAPEHQLAVDARPAPEPQDAAVPPAVSRDEPAARPRPARPAADAPVRGPSKRPPAPAPVPDTARAKDTPSPERPKQPKEKPLERIALAGVGVDPVAEAFWLEAINSPATSARDRHDLIEDLNEEGFPDPRRPTADDLPMIVNRLALIEQEAPFAVDKVNADAFAEAYKDLVNMYAKVVSR